MEIVNLGNDNQLLLKLLGERLMEILFTRDRFAENTKAHEI